ncbi:MAG: hypothetical protein IIB58_07900 [Planctomycetes bacterium]|nr:hypothetical protein [Planctomycetota bacterium]
MAAKKEQKKDEQSEEQAAPFTNRNRNLLTAVVVGGLMLLEGVGIFVAVKIMGGGPDTLRASDGTGQGSDADGKMSSSEVRVTDLMAFNSNAGRVFVYQLSVYAEIDAEESQKIEDMIKSRQNAIDDRFSKVIRGSDPKYLDEPGLETLRRQFKHELEQILGDDSHIKAILFPEFKKSRAD